MKVPITMMMSNVEMRITPVKDLMIDFSNSFVHELKDFKNESLKDQKMKKNEK